MIRPRHHRLGLSALLIAGLAGRLAPAAAEPLHLGDDDRLLVLAPHPDDETLAAGGLIQEALGLDVPVRVCYFTMGDNNEIAFLFTRQHPVQTPGAMRSLGPRRQNEAIAAATQLGLSTNDLVFLGYPDTGSLEIWQHHWRTVPPFRSKLTRATAVPHAQVFTPGSAHAGEDILEDLEEVIRDFQPTHVVVSHPADHNVDHRALYLFTRVALWNLEAEGLAPEILAAPVHFTHWPEPRRHQPQRPAMPPRFLDGQIEWSEYTLAPFQVATKRAALRRHHSQYQQAPDVLEVFIRKSELFGDFQDLALPGGLGSVRLDEDDTSQFRPDRALFEELARASDAWNAVAEQNAAESAALNDHDNDFTERSISGDGSHLTLTFEFLKPLAPSSRLTACLSGYRADTPFGDLPKIAIEATPRKILSVNNLDVSLPVDAVELVSAGEDQVALRIPFALLGQPEKIFTGARISNGKLPVDWVAWRVIDLAGASLPAPLPAPAVRKLPPAPPPPAGEAAPAEPPPALKPESLQPRVTLPRKSVPARSEANEPVVW